MNQLLREQHYWIEDDIDIKVLGGLSITVSAKFIKAETQSGKLGDYMVEWEVTHTHKRRVKKPPIWLYARLEAAGVTEDDISDLIMEARK